MFAPFQEDPLFLASCPGEGSCFPRYLKHPETASGLDLKRFASLRKERIVFYALIFRCTRCKLAVISVSVDFKSISFSMFEPATLKENTCI